MLNIRLVKKYNKLLLEAVKYYNVESCIAYSEYRGMGLIISCQLKYNVGFGKKYSTFKEFLSDYYPYLVPFEQLQLTSTNMESQNDRSVFNEINKVIKKIRKEKSDVNI